MKSKLALLLTLTLLPLVRAEEARFFRVVGPVASIITAFSANGYVTWTNEPTNATFTVQTAVSLAGPSNWVDYIQVPATEPATTERLYDPNPPAGMVLIPAGLFTMGNSIGDGDIIDASPTNVTVSAFYMDANLVSYDQWQSAYNWATNHGYGFVHAGLGKAANHPVVMVNWYDVVKWSNARSQQAGLAPVYYTDGGLTQVYTNGETDAVYVNWAAQGYRLLTEAEWEKAARGGLSEQRFPWGNTISGSQANYYGDTSYIYDLGPNDYNPAFTNGGFPYTSPVGSFAANGYGLYDMAGNVDEWCGDWYGEPYAGGSDPRGPASGSVRVQRGGGWFRDAYFPRCTCRVANYPDSAKAGFGFRCVRGL